jgi:transcriptional regulator with XRE-family HTH domain
MTTKLRKYRLAAGLTQVQFYELSGVRQQQISFLEMNGCRRYSLAAIRLGLALGCDPQALIEDSAGVVPTAPPVATVEGGSHVA